MKKPYKKIMFWACVALVPGGSILLLYEIVKREIKETSSAKNNSRAKNTSDTSNSSL